MPQFRRRYKLGTDLCAYCGANVCTDREDPIPMALFPKSIRGSIQFLKIPACNACNNAKSQVDGALRDLLTLDFQTQNHPLIQELFEEKFVTAIKKNNVRMLDRFLEGRPRPITTPSGFFLEMGYEFPTDTTPAEMAIGWLTRGMQWVVSGQAVSPHVVKAHRVEGEMLIKLNTAIDPNTLSGAYQQGEPYLGAWIDKFERYVFWIHCFFGRIFYLARVDRMQNDDASTLGK